jgi:hypothetical protein
MRRARYGKIANALGMEEKLPSFKRRGQPQEAELEKQI